MDQDRVARRKPRKTPVVVAGITPQGAPFSTAIACAPARLLFVSGLLARDDAGAIVAPGDVAAQTRRIVENLAKVLEAAGATLVDVVRLDIHVTDIARRDEVNAVRREAFPDVPPTSTMVEVAALAHPDARVEITAIAVLP